MKQVKISLAGVKGKLSRSEMKNIAAGSGGNPCTLMCERGLLDVDGNFTCPMGPSLCFSLGKGNMVSCVCS